MDRFALLDGIGMPLDEAAIPVTDPAFTRGWSVFETLRSIHGSVAYADQHLDRLEASCSTARIPMPPRALLEAELAAVVGVVPNARLRITLTGGGRRIVTAEPLDLERIHAPVRAVTRPWRPDPLVGGSVKHGGRASWSMAVAASGADEVLFVDERGRFGEGTSSAILAVVAGVIRTAPHDGRILPSVTCRSLLDDARALGIPVSMEPASISDALDALYIASTTRHLAPVVELDGRPMPGWDPIGEALAARGMPHLW